MISKKHNFVFIHIPKTGGTSVGRGLLRKYGPAKYPHKTLIGELEDGPAGAHKYFKFAFVRNPWDLLVSLYSFDRRPDRAGKRGNKSASKFTFKQWVKWFCKEKNRKVDGRPVRHYRPQTFWMINKQGKLAMDFVGRFEHLDRDYKVVCDAVGLPYKPLPHTNKSDHSHYTECYDRQTRLLVRNHFMDDIKNFGYRFGD